MRLISGWRTWANEWTNDCAWANVIAHWHHITIIVGTKSGCERQTRGAAPTQRWRITKIFIARYILNGKLWNFHSLPYGGGVYARAQCTHCGGRPTTLLGEMCFAWNGETSRQQLGAVLWVLHGVGRWDENECVWRELNEKFWNKHNYWAISWIFNWIISNVEETPFSTLCCYICDLQSHRHQLATSKRERNFAMKRFVWSFPSFDRTPSPPFIHIFLIIFLFAQSAPAHHIVSATQIQQLSNFVCTRETMWIVSSALCCAFAIEDEEGIFARNTLTKITIKWIRIK